MLIPLLKRYTCHSRGKSSRLDYCFISEHLLNELESYKILRGLHSGHSILKIELGNETINTVKMLWTFNNSLLHDANYVKSIKETIEKCETEYLDLVDRGLDWEMTKIKIRAFSVPLALMDYRQISINSSSVTLY